MSIQDRAQFLKLSEVDYSHPSTRDLFDQHIFANQCRLVTMLVQALEGIGGERSWSGILRWLAFIFSKTGIAV